MSSYNTTRLAELRKQRRVAGILDKLFKRYKKDHPDAKRPPKSLVDKAKAMGGAGGGSGTKQKMSPSDLGKMSDGDLGKRRDWLMNSKNRQNMSDDDVRAEHLKIKQVLRSRKAANSADQRKLGVGGKTAGGKSMEDALRSATDRFGKAVIRQVTKLIKKDSKGKAKWTDIVPGYSNTVNFKVGGKDGRISVFLFSGSSKGIEIHADVQGKSWMKIIPLNMSRDAVTIASDAYYSVPQNMRP